MTRRRAEIPNYSFESHQRLEKTTSIYSPHVLVLEGIFALYDQRVLDLLDMKIFADEDGKYSQSLIGPFPAGCHNHGKILRDMVQSAPT